MMKTSQNSNRRVAYFGVFAALALMMSYVEMLIPLPFLVPGMKLGLANVVVVVALYHMDAKSALFVSVVRILLAGLLFQGFAGLLYSLSGGLMSLLAMVLLKKIKGFSIIGVSVVGAVFHNVGQILVAAAVVENLKLFYYLPVLLIFAAVTGTLIGVVAGRTLALVEKRQ
ncbi:Gx transporter family protein [Chakrabartyella piscis]|uniref:Gx transporter family protein n=1 Tax=Chakrabartyella piscis TaxID=2918914 RepID=UPI00295856E1|nr:Gx transporter family protein [Chakrabartyella piscis]